MLHTWRLRPAWLAASILTACQILLKAHDFDNGYKIRQKTSDFRISEWISYRQRLALSEKSADHEICSHVKGLKESQVFFPTVHVIIEFDGWGDRLFYAVSDDFTRSELHSDRRQTDRGCCTNRRLKTG